MSCNVDNGKEEKISSVFLLTSISKSELLNDSVGCVFEIVDTCGVVVVDVIVAVVTVVLLAEEDTLCELSVIDTLTFKVAEDVI